MSIAQTLKKQFAPQKLLFNFIFWGVHWGLFAFGWYEPTRREGNTGRMSG